MRKILLQSVIALGLMTFVTGVIYPLCVTLVARVLWPTKANGSIVRIDDKIIGSELLAQQFTNQAYFWPRPSATSYNSVPGGASNLGPTSQKLKGNIIERSKLFADDTLAPYELLMASGSGLDPHISPRAAKHQIARVVTHTRLPEDQLVALVDKYTERPTFGILGKERVNVLKLNLALNELKK